MNSHITRRNLLKTSVAASAAAGLASFAHAAGSETIKVGLVGCGGRGSGAAGQALAADKGVVLHALGDAFEDRVKGAYNNFKKSKGEQMQTTEDRCFVGFDAYKKVIDSGVDVVILASPPGFRPAQLQYAIAAGKHVFTEKPMAVDAPGYRSVLQTVEQAKQKKLNLVSGFCWRYSFPEREFFKRVFDGAIGDITAIYSAYLAGFLWSNPRQPNWSDMEFQMRNWLYYTWLSGDHIVEQAVHTIDKIGWALKDQAPVRAVALGGRQVRTESIYGHIYDHFAVQYEFPGGVRATMFTRQQSGTAGGTTDHIMGTRGIANIDTGGAREIRPAGGDVWRYSGPNNNMYQTEHDELFASIRAGKIINDGPQMMNSTMLAIMGRMAAYTGQVITWDKAINSQEDLTPKNLAFGPLDFPPVAMPGRTKFI